MTSLLTSLVFTLYSTVPHTYLPDQLPCMFTQVLPGTYWEDYAILWVDVLSLPDMELKYISCCAMI